LGVLAIAGLLTIGAAKLSPTERRMKAYEASHPEVRHFGGKVTKPVLISETKTPVFPPEVLRHRRLTGTILLEAVVDEHGLVKDPAILNPTDLDLQPYVVKSFRTWRFKPARLGGKPVPVFYVLTFNIHLQ
jgi:protein TonB